MYKKSGFTIMELIVVIAMIAVMTAIAVPNYLSWIPRKRLRSAGDELFANLTYTKMQAIKNNANWSVVFNTPVAGSYQILDGGGIPVKTVELARYKSGVTFGMGNASGNARPGCSNAPGGIGYTPAPGSVVFNTRGMINPGAGATDCVYLTNQFGDAVAVGTPSLAGVIVQSVWRGAAWQ